MIIDTSKFTKREGYLEAPAKAIASEFSETAKQYKRKISTGFMLVDGAKITEKIGGEDFCVTKKIDGEMQVVFVRDDEVFMSNNGGKIRTGLPCLDEFAKLVKKAKLDSATIVAELYVIAKDGKRTRVSDVSKALGDSKLAKELALAPFDIIDIDGEKFEAAHYREKHDKLKALFKGGKLVNVVEAKNASNTREVAQIFEEWISEKGEEGLVVYNETTIVYKVKPRHTIDAVVIGYSVGEAEDNDKVRDILVAVVREDGLIQQFGATGNGFTDQQRAEFFTMLSAKSVQSEYIETDSRNIAFQMIKPEVVVELSVIDFMSENASGEPKFNKLVSFDSNEGYKFSGETAGVSALSMVFERIRDDKPADSVGVRVSQLSDLCPFAETKSKRISGLPKSELLVRKLYKKGEGKKLMIQKFAVWKTNKEDSGMFPAYVLHHTDFSCGRKEPLKRDIRVSSDKTQIMKFFDEFIAENIKKGWVEI